MKLSELISHTSDWIGVPRSTVESVAKYLRPAGLLSSGGRGPGGAIMTNDDKVNLLLGVCGVEVANRAADHVRRWRTLVGLSVKDPRFAFTQSKTVKDFFVDLITKDLNGGALDVWLKEADDAYDREQVSKAAPRHSITLDFYIDEFSFTIVVSRFITPILSDDRKQSFADVIEVKFIEPAPGPENDYTFVGQRLRNEDYEAGSRLIRRLDADNIRGWGTCLA